MKRRPFLLACFVACLGPTRATAEEVGDEPTVLGSFTTTYAHDPDHKARASNIELAAEAVDGKVIPPGGTFSFNEAVGERTAAFGFAKSIVLRDGMLAEGAGGGTCQVASTLHAAALLGGLEILVRAPHSRPSAYIRMGLDATVAFGSIDLKLKNPNSASVVLHAHARRGALVVSISGTTPKPDVTLTSEIIEWLPIGRVVERAASVPDDRAHVVALGIPGYRVRRTRRLRSADGERHDVRVDLYPPVPTTFRVRRPESVDDAEPVVDPGVQRPVLVQLRPSTRVTLDNH